VDDDRQGGEDIDLYSLGRDLDTTLEGLCEDVFLNL
jgi:hypothetical protein